MEVEKIITNIRDLAETAQVARSSFPADELLTETKRADLHMHAGLTTLKRATSPKVIPEIAVKRGGRRSQKSGVFALLNKYKERPDCSPNTESHSRPRSKKSNGKLSNQKPTKRSQRHKCIYSGNATEVKVDSVKCMPPVTSPVRIMTSYQMPKAANIHIQTECCMQGEILLLYLDMTTAKPRLIRGELACASIGP